MPTKKPLCVGGALITEFDNTDTIPFDNIPALLVNLTGKTVSVSSWTLNSGVYEADISDAAITANSLVIVAPNNADADICIAAQLLPQNQSFAGYVRIYAKNIPAASITFSLNVLNLPQ